MPIVIRSGSLKLLESSRSVLDLCRGSLTYATGKKVASKLSVAQLSNTRGMYGNGGKFQSISNIGNRRLAFPITQQKCSDRSGEV